MPSAAARRYPGPCYAGTGEDTGATTAPSLDDGPLRASLVSTQAVGLIMARYIVRVEPLASLPPEDVAVMIAPTLQRYLAEPL